ncbi:hypothetical protein KCP75_02485 [Salmonella enterica subsp. enterica]|nr:hypothetical protein KCP75_02485 [Salmonella enterica subsp. enterica]
MTDNGWFAARPSVRKAAPGYCESFTGKKNIASRLKETVEIIGGIEKRRGRYGRKRGLTTPFAQ